MATSLLLESSQFKTTQKPLKYAEPSSAYILSIVSLPGHYAASESAPSNKISILDKSTLRGIGNLSGHDVGTTSLKAVGTVVGIAGRTLLSSGKDGSVKIWDPRSNSHSIKMTNLGASRSLLCCDISPDGLTVAAGTDKEGEDALILYWDPRQPAAPLRIHGSTHSDDITTLSFAQPDSGMPRNTLLSASSDGLICTSNANETDEDEAVLFVGNWGTSVSQAGWNNAPSGPRIWAASDMETFSTWTEEFDMCQSVNIRSAVLHGRHTWVTDYLITSMSNPNTPGSLGVVVGSNEGDVALLSNANLSAPDAPWYLHNVWSAGHVGVVRSLLWDHESSVLVTGGEDGKINVWPSLSPEHQVDHESMDVDSNLRKRSRDRDEEQEGKRARR